MSEEPTKEERIEKEYKSLQEYSEKDFIRYEKFMRFVGKRLTNKKLWWVLSWIPYIIIWGLLTYAGAFKFELITLFLLVVSHSIYWFFAGDKSTQKLVDDLQEDVDISLEIIEKVKEERLKK